MNLVHLRLFLGALVMQVTLVGPVPVSAQDSGDSGESTLRTRQLWDTTLMNRRPASPQKPAAPSLPPSGLKPVKGSLVGITVWRLRPGKPGDSAGVRALIQEEATSEEWMPERIASDTTLVEGQRVRISVEAAQEGYLYVIDRDEYMDGSKGDPYLIFPTRRTRGGDNKIAPGVVVEIPAADDKPPYFKVQRSRPDQTTEVLTIVVTPKPIEGLEISRGRQKLDETQLATWARQWHSKSSHLEARAEEGKPYTAAEKEAGSGRKLLTQNDPVPQTMYDVDAKPGEASEIELGLKIAP